jgi:hypothetical protein
MNTISIKVIVAGYNASGDPDFFFCKVSCTQQQYNEGEHYDIANQAAEDEGYEPAIAFDENDTAGKAIMDKFVWESATEYTIEICRRQHY